MALPPKSPRPSRRALAIAAAVLVAAVVFSGGWYVEHASQRNPQSNVEGEANCPNPPPVFNSSFNSSPPAIGWPASEYSYSGGCYRVLVFEPLQTGAALAGALVNVSVWPASGPGSYYDSTPPPGYSCQPPPGALPGACFYVPPPKQWADGVTNGSGVSVVALGLPLGSYFVSVSVWIDGTDSGFDGAFDRNANVTWQPLEGMLQPVGYTPGSTDVQLGVFYGGATGLSSSTDTVEYSVVDVQDGNTTPYPGANLTRLGALDGLYTIFPVALSSAETSDELAYLDVQVLGPTGSVLASALIDTVYFTVPVPN